MTHEQARAFSNDIILYLCEVCRHADHTKGGILEKMAYFLRFHSSSIGLSEKQAEERVSRIDSYVVETFGGRGRLFIDNILNIYTEGSKLNLDEEMISLFALRVEIENLVRELANYPSDFVQDHAGNLQKELENKRAEIDQELIELLSSEGA